MKNILSQFQLIGSNLVSIEFKVYSGVPTETSNVSIEIGRSFEDTWSNDEREATCECRVAIKSVWKNEDSSVEVCAASCEIRGITEGVGIERTEESERYLHANAISFLYSKARAFIELVSYSSEVGVKSLPAIVPLEMLDNNEDETKNPD